MNAYYSMSNINFNLKLIISNLQQKNLLIKSYLQDRFLSNFLHWMHAENFHSEAEFSTKLNKGEQR